LNLSAVEKSQRAALLWILCGLLVVFTVLASVAKYGQSVIVTGASRRVVRDIRAAVFGHLMSLSVRFHQKNHSAQLVSRITSDLEIFGRFLTEALIRFIQDGFEFLVMLIFVAANSGGFIFVIVAVIAVAVAPVNHIAKKLRHNDKKTQAGMAEVATVIQEVLTGQRVVKAFAAEGREIARFRKVTRTHMKSQMRTRRLRSLTEPIVMGIGALGVAAIIVVGGYRVLDGKMDGASLIINVMALGKAMANLRGMSKQLSDFQLGLAAADRVGTVLQARSEIGRSRTRCAAAVRARDPFDAVRFHHDPGSRRAGHRPADPQGREGRAGRAERAGKTTFIDLVPRLCAVDAGRISIDGRDVRDVALKSLREQIGIVSQETVLFRDSIRDNIAYGKPGATDEQIVAAAVAANAQDFIVKKPGGYAARRRARPHALGRRAAAHRDCAGDLAGSSDPDPGRGDLGARLRVGGGRAGGAAAADGRTHRHRHRAPPFDHPRRRPHRRAREGARGRGRQPRRAHAARGQPLPAPPRDPDAQLRSPRTRDQRTGVISARARAGRSRGSA
jgi:subfamily B ATP-binding cassette protein MsbA